LLLKGNQQNSEMPMVAQPENRMYGDPVLIAPRLGQGAFRVMVTDFYERRCAVTREKSLPVLEAAHIKPVAERGTHGIGNGLLIRSDIHRLFDRGYVTVTPDCHFRVSHRLKDDFDNGEVYYRLNGSKIWVPQDPSKRPDRELLEWHSDTIFLG
jgi:putative restriction endonuclease